MNKFKFFLIAVVILATSGTAMAQKTGYINVDQIVGIMPDVRKIDSTMQKYQIDSIAGEYEILIRDYKYRDSILTSKDTLTMPKTVKEQHQAALQNVAYQIQNWQQISQNAYQSKQNQLLEPVYRKVMSAIQTVAKEKGYAYVYDKSALIVAPPGDDLLVAVAAKLNLKLPPNTTGGLR
jgi:outer membrane protein